VTLVTPRDMESEWGAIENVLQKVTEKMLPEKSPEPKNIDDIFREKPSYTKPSYYTEPTPTEENKPTEESASSIIDEWAPDLEELRKELAESDDKAETKEEE
ncbi:MAG: hypothetical protein WA019_03900, partial [Candidatus Moraniibacteriota bacterium]